MTSLTINRYDDILLVSDPRRVITKPFLPGQEVFPDGHSRIEIVLNRILAMSDQIVTQTLDETNTEFVGRHLDLEAILESNLAIVADKVDLPASLSDERKRLIAMYFTQEFSIEAAALGNPSIVAAPDQTGLGSDENRFIMSLRAIGEGHISSIEFRTGIIDADMNISIDQTSRHAVTGSRTAPLYNKNFFTTKLGDLGALNKVAEMVLAGIGPNFTITELEESIAALEAQGVDRTISFETTRILHWLASSNYKITYPEWTKISERVIFPSGPTESHGMEDARLVRFVDDDGSVMYYATYTAYDGYQILPQLIETVDFKTFRIATLSGDCAHNKGIALFPRKLNGQFTALGRYDNINNFVMMSDDVRVWQHTEKIQEPERPWELVQLGNCGSPIETEAGWLVITHGVGPMRRYALGALLLDIDDPCRVIGHLKEPLLAPTSSEREGYVPNVVYSCGAMIHGGHLVLPYGFADVRSSVATVALDDLLTHLTQ